MLDWIGNVQLGENSALSSLGLPAWMCLAAVTSFLLYLGLKRMQKTLVLDKLPGPSALPILGNAIQLSGPPHEFLGKISKWCDEAVGSSVFRMYLGMDAYVVCFKASSIEAILSSTKHITKGIAYYFLLPWLGTGLLTSTGSKWHSRRKLLTPTFHFRILEDFLEIFNEQAQILTKKLQKHSNNKKFDIFPSVTHCALDIICETAMGRNLNAQDDNESEYVEAIYKIGNIIQQRQIKPWLQNETLFTLLGYKKIHDECLKILHDFTNLTIQERREKMRKEKLCSENINKEDDLGRKKKRAFLDFLISYSDDGKVLSDEDIREEVDTFMFEGHDTTAAAISWCLYLLGHNPKIQMRVHEELDRVFGDDPTRPASTNDLSELKYLDCCIKEALRQYPSVPLITRELKEDAILDGHQIPRGTQVMMVPFKLHMDPEQFPNPTEFNPDRFLAENSVKRHPYAYVPFSAGPRNCIGQKFAQMEEKVVVSTILRQYRVESCTPKDDMEINGELIMRPQNGFIMKIYSRN